LGTNAFSYLEYRDKEDTVWHGEEVDLPRNYRIYDAIAGGRSGRGFLFPPRGLPYDSSEAVIRGACALVIDEEPEVWRAKTNSPNYVPVINSSKVDSDFRTFALPNGERRAYYFIGDHSYISGHTWLTVAELDKCFELVRPNKVDEAWENFAIRMHDIERRGALARLVIYFVG